MLHSPFERETMLAPPAQPPAYDMAFVLRADPRVMWPAEAKVLASPGSLAAYLADIREQFLTCRYAPFTNSGAMVGYLLSGTAGAALENIGRRLGLDFDDTEPMRTGRPSRVTTHDRDVPVG